MLAAIDPAQPYGGGAALARAPGATRGPQRVSGAYVVLVGAEPVLYVERGGRGLQMLAEPADPRVSSALDALAAFVTSGGARLKLGLERVDGEPVVGSAVGTGADRGGVLARGRAKLTLER